MFCINCGSELPDNAKFCASCGTKTAACTVIADNQNQERTFTDPRDGKTYRTVKIDNLVWMAENLNFEREGSVCYGNDPEKAEKYGRLYDWETAKKACPLGWHLPSKKEWDVLINFVGGKEFAGRMLKVKSEWYNYNNGMDEYGFSALPGGFGNSDGSFKFVDSCGCWWSASGILFFPPYALSMDYDSTKAYWGYHSKSNLFSVRCVKDYFHLTKEY